MLICKTTNRDARRERNERIGKMAKLHFYYGVMSSSKSAQLGINAFNFRRTDNRWEAIKPISDNRDSPNDIVSRIGIRTKGRALPDLENYKPKRKTQFLLVDEVQFFKESDIEKLVHIADNTKITIFCYGLKVDSNGDLFKASAKLFAEADELHNMETVCEMPGCVNSATHHLRFDNNGNIIRGGAQVEVGADQYISVCRKDYHRFYDDPNANLLQYLHKKRMQKIK